MKLMALAFASVSAFFAVAPFVAAAGDSVCQVKVRYWGSLPDQTYGEVNDNNIKCEGACTDAEKCKKVTYMPLMGGVSKYIFCRCPSGGGSGKCRGEAEAEQASDGTWKIVDLQCKNDSSCGQNADGDEQSCSWYAWTISGSKWLKCKCQ